MALSQIKLARPQIGSAPCTEAGCEGTVGVPVWLWTQPWTPQQATASVSGVTVTVRANIESVTWRMGDGGTVTCTSPGTAYQEWMGWTSSPDCGYMYSKASRNQPGGVYKITADANWHIAWTGAYNSTASIVTRSSVTVPVGESQVVIVNR